MLLCWQNHPLEMDSVHNHSVGLVTVLTRQHSYSMCNSESESNTRNRLKWGILTLEWVTWFHKFLPSARFVLLLALLMSSYFMLVTSWVCYHAHGIMRQKRAVLVDETSSLSHFFSEKFLVKSFVHITSMSPKVTFSISFTMITGGCYVVRNWCGPK